MKIALVGVDTKLKLDLYNSILEFDPLFRFNPYTLIELSGEADLWEILAQYVQYDYFALTSIYDLWAFNRLAFGLDYHFRMFGWASRHVKYDHVLYVEPDYNTIGEDGVQIDQETLNIMSFLHIPFHVINDYQGAFRVLSV